MADDEGIIGEYIDDHAMGISGDDIDKRIPGVQNRNAKIIHENGEHSKRNAELRASVDAIRAKTERVQKEVMVLEVARAKLLIELSRQEQDSASEKDNDRFLEMCTVKLWEEMSVLKSPRKGREAGDDNNWGSAKDGGLGRNNLIGGMNQRDLLVIVGGSFIAAIAVAFYTQAFRKR